MIDGVDVVFIIYVIFGCYIFNNDPKSRLMLIVPKVNKKINGTTILQWQIQQSLIRRQMKHISLKY